MQTNRSVLGWAALMVGLGLAHVSTTQAATMPSNLFNHQYNGNVYNNPNIPGYTEFPSDGPGWAPTVVTGVPNTIDGAVLSTKAEIAAGGGYWQSDEWLGGPNPVSNGTGWTIEFRVKIGTDEVGGSTFGAMQVFAKDGNGTSSTGRRVALNVGQDYVKLTSLNTNSIDSSDNTDDFHVFRIMQPANSRSVTIWRDGVHLFTGDSKGNNDSSSLPAQMYFGDGSGDTGGPTVQYDYFRWDSTGAWEYEASPVPEPGTVLLVFTGICLAQTAGRRRGE
jgi:hypothetical protein